MKLLIKFILNKYCGKGGKNEENKKKLLTTITKENRERKLEVFLELSWRTCNI